MRASGRLSACLLVLLGSLSIAATRAPVVRIETGTLAGTDTDGVRRFAGIPYAAPPVGALRWRPPQPPAHWTGVRSAADFGARCVQQQSAGVVPRPAAISEDCLFLNVWTAARTGQPEPVLLWIHGGGSIRGTGSDPVFDGTHLARKGIVVVTINYRLGALGFLSLPALDWESGGHGSGNYGFMDDIAALRWVQHNIVAFGGDPGRVTIAGESSGSVAVGVLMASPLARGLFAQAIGESGSVFRRAERGSMGATTLAAEDAKGERLFHYEQARRGHGDLAFLRTLPAATLNADADAVVNTTAFYNLPVVDGTVLTEAPAKTFAAHRQNDVPLLAGWNATEGSLMRGPTMDGTPDEILAQRFSGAAASLRPFYPGADPAQEAASDLRLLGDESIAYGTWAWAAAQLATGTHPVFLYVFERAPRIPAHRYPIPEGTAGAFHGAEMAYVFDNLDAESGDVEKGWTIDATDRRVAAQMSSYWAGFVRTGVPAGAGLPRWAAYDFRDPRKLHLGAATASAPDGDLARMRALASAHAVADPALAAQP